jgi:hypothetical protein
MSYSWSQLIPPCKTYFQIIFQGLIHFFTIAFQKCCSSFFSYICNSNNKVIIAYNIVSRFIICIESSYKWLEKAHIQILQFLFLNSFFLCIYDFFFSKIVLCTYNWFIPYQKKYDWFMLLFFVQFSFF